MVAFSTFSKFADYDGGSQVRSQRPSRLINLPYTGDVGDWQSVPGLANSTHRCWNWGRPDICWEYLNRLGFDSNLIGPRPGDPAEEPRTKMNERQLEQQVKTQQQAARSIRLQNEKRASGK